MVHTRVTMTTARCDSRTEYFSRASSRRQLTTPEWIGNLKHAFGSAVCLSGWPVSFYGYILGLNIVAHFHILPTAFLVSSLYLPPYQQFRHCVFVVERPFRASERHKLQTLSVYQTFSFQPKLHVGARRYTCVWSSNTMHPTVPIWDRFIQRLTILNLNP